MNIFYLHHNPILAARAHCDKHVNAMAKEGAQMLSTALFKLAPIAYEHKAHLLYEPTHVNHPCNKWVRESVVNFQWLLTLVNELDTEHFNRYETFTEHAIVAEQAWELLLDVKKLFPATKFFLTPATPPAQAMPEELRIPGDPVKAYRRYYKQHKSNIAKWERGVKPPTWWDKEEV